MKQRTKVNGSYSNFGDIFSGVPQGSILGVLLFNIYICDLFFGIGDLYIASYADDNTRYIFSSEIDVASKKLKSYTIKIFEWFCNNRLKSNAGKCNLLRSPTSPVEFQSENTIISSVNRVKLLGLYINDRLNFVNHGSKICKKARKKLRALSRVSEYMNINKRRMPMKAWFIILEFSYFSMVLPS